MKIRMSVIRRDLCMVGGWIKTLHINGIKPVFIEEGGKTKRRVLQQITKK